MKENDKAMEKNEEAIKEIAYIAWKAAANAHRMYPDNKHTFVEYWIASATQFDKYSKIQTDALAEKDKEIEELKEKLKTIAESTGRISGIIEEAKLLNTQNEVAYNSLKQRADKFESDVEAYLDKKVFTDLQQALLNYKIVQANAGI